MKRNQIKLIYIPNHICMTASVPEMSNV